MIASHCVAQEVVSIEVGNVLGSLRLVLEIGLAEGESRKLEIGLHITEARFLIGKEEAAADISEPSGHEEAIVEDMGVFELIDVGGTALLPSRLERPGVAGASRWHGSFRSASTGS